MTLIELLVSLGVLAVICVAFATIMAQTHRVVDRSNALMGANATASAVAQALRDDLARFCPQGFLAVYEDPSGRPHLIFTAVGPFTSNTDTSTPKATANAARIDYGLDPSGNLWRRAVLLTGTSTSVTTWDPNVDYDDSVWLGRYDLNLLLHVDLTQTTLEEYCKAPPIPMEPNASNVRDLWPLLARPCGAFKVSYLKGTSWASDPNTWTAADFANPTTTTNPLPSAIKVNFRLKTGQRPEEFLDYEVICPIRQ